MKFTDGNWLIRPGYDIVTPVELFDLRAGPDSLTIYASPRPTQHRWAQIDTPLLTVHCSSPMPDVICVRIYHHKGGRPRSPAFAIYQDPGTPVETGESATEAYLSSGNLRVSFRKDRWAMDLFYDGDRITGSGPRSMAYISAAGNQSYVREQLDLSVGEYVYGLGERFTPFIKNGQVVETWNCDGGTSTEQAYKNVPFYLSSKGYGVFVNHPEAVSFEVASEKVSKVQLSVAGQYLEYFIIAGPSPKQVLENYTRLTGRPALPPAWSFGLWLTTSFTTDYDEETVTHFVDGMKERDLPLHVFHFDCFWMKAFQWMDFNWDPVVFPEPEPMLRRLHEKGLRICVWLNPYIAQQSSLFDEAAANGYLLKRADGDVWQWDKWQPGMGIVDFTNPEACRWYADHLRRLIDMGVHGFKTDFGERIPTDVVYFDGSDPQKMHNYYSYLYNKVVFEVLEERLGQGEAVLFARSATAGGQRFPVHWGGDSFATYESMAESLRGGLSLGLSGFGFWSHDIGGFESTAPADLYKRWTAFGLLSSHSRLHGNHSYRVPWLFDDEAVDVLRFFTKLKCRLMPYLFAAACEAAQTGVPVMRAMLLEFPGDPTCYFLDRQYMLGESLLVAPVFSQDGNVSFYLPRGRWTHFLTGEQVEGGIWRSEHHSYMSLPLYVRPNSVVAVGREDNRPDYPYADGVEFHVFGLGDGQSASATVTSTRGVPELTAHVQREAETVTVRVSGGEWPWSLLLRGVFRVASVEGAGVEATPSGVRILPAPGVAVVGIRLLDQEANGHG
ncbi:MAG: alpha-xylosidase [Bacillota bacterium]